MSIFLNPICLNEGKGPRSHAQLGSGRAGGSHCIPDAVISEPLCFMTANHTHGWSEEAGMLRLLSIVKGSLRLHMGPPYPPRISPAELWSVLIFQAVHFKEPVLTSANSFSNTICRLC